MKHTVKHSVIRHNCSSEISFLTITPDQGTHHILQYMECTLNLTSKSWENLRVCHGDHEARFADPKFDHKTVLIAAILRVKS